MGERRGMSSQEKREYARLQERKKRQIERQYAKSMGLDNPAKSVSGKGRVPNPKKQRRGRPERRKKNVFGNILVILHLLVSIAFLGVLVLSNIIPMKYLIVIALCLLFLWGIGLVSQVKRRKKGTSGKVFIIVITLLLGIGAYYVGVVTGALDRITGGNSKVDAMVVAVLKDDPADKIQDAAGYTFGVQYHESRTDMVDTVSHLNEELGRDIETTEYHNVSEQAKALHNGEVKAIIYNEAYKEILEEEFGDFSENVKIIYTYNIKTELKNLSLDVNVLEPFTVYISGIDVYGDISKSSRSDVNILATVNPSTRQILLVTTPRDYYIPIPNISHGQRDKLTHAGLYGVDASMATLSELYDTEIPFFARINFSSLIKIVDTLGGVDVISEHDFTTSKNAGHVFHVKKGLNHLNGKEALAFSRERKRLADGDNQRGRNQQAVITAMIKKMVSPSMLIKANAVINSVSDGVDTNMSQGQIQSLIRMQLDKGGSWNIKSVSAKATGDWQACYSSGSRVLWVAQPDYNSVEEIKALIDQVENGEILADGEKTE